MNNFTSVFFLTFLIQNKRKNIDLSRCVQIDELMWNQTEFITSRSLVYLNKDKKKKKWSENIVIQAGVDTWYTKKWIFLFALVGSVCPHVVIPKSQKHVRFESIGVDAVKSNAVGWYWKIGSSSKSFWLDARLVFLEFYIFMCYRPTPACSWYLQHEIRYDIDSLLSIVARFFLLPLLLVLC